MCCGDVSPVNHLCYCVSLCLAKSIIGGTDEHIAFLLLRALELQGEIEEAFGFAVIYKALDPQVTLPYGRNKLINLIERLPLLFLILALCC